MEIDPNPYAPPASRLETPEVPPAVADLASSTQRFSNLLLDTVGNYALAVVVGVAASLVDPERFARVNDLAFGISISTLYFGSSEALTGRTPAKYITGTRVVSERGGRASLRQILLRTLVRLVPFEAFSFLGADDHPVGWHDRWSGTRVIRTRPRNG